MAFHLIAGAVLAGCFVWLAVDPGWGTFAIFVAAFLLWAATLMIRLARRALHHGRRAYGKLHGHLLGAEPELALSPEAEALVARDPQLAELRRDFLQLGQDRALQHAAARARRQLQLLPQVMGNLEGLLRQKLNPDEVTFVRYRDSGLQAYAAVRRELDEVADRMRGIYGPGAHRPGLLGLLLQRAAPQSAPALDPVRKEQLAAIETMLDASERGLDEMVKMNVAVSQMRGTSGRDDAELPELMQKLGELAARAPRY